MYPCSTRECNDIRVTVRERVLEWRTSFRIENFLDLKIIFTIEWINYFRRLKRVCYFLNIRQKVLFRK